MSLVWDNTVDNNNKVDNCNFEDYKVEDYKNFTSYNGSYFEEEEEEEQEQNSFNGYRKELNENSTIYYGDSMFGFDIDDQLFVTKKRKETKVDDFPYIYVEDEFGNREFGDVPLKKFSIFDEEKEDYGFGNGPDNGFGSSDKKPQEDFWELRKEQRKQQAYLKEMNKQRLLKAPRKNDRKKHYKW